MTNDIVERVKARGARTIEVRTLSSNLPDEATIRKALSLQAKIDSGELVAVTPDKVDNWNYGEPPKDGSKFYGKYYSPYKWKPYKPQARKQGYPAGRWQCMNEYGGWENAKNPPSQWLTDKDFNEKEKSAPQVEAQEGE